MATEELPTSAGAWRARAELQLCGSDWQAAIAASQKAIELDSDPTGESHLALAIAQCHAGNRPEAKQCYETAVRRLANKRSSPRLEALRQQVQGLLESAGNSQSCAGDLRRLSLRERAG